MTVEFSGRTVLFTVAVALDRQTDMDAAVPRRDAATGVNGRRPRRTFAKDVHAQRASCVHFRDGDSRVVTRMKPAGACCGSIDFGSALITIRQVFLVRRNAPSADERQRACCFALHLHDGADMCRPTCWTRFTSANLLRQPTAPPELKANLKLGKHEDVPRD